MYMASAVVCISVKGTSKRIKIWLNINKRLKAQPDYGSHKIGELQTYILCLRYCEKGCFKDG